MDRLPAVIVDMDGTLCDVSAVVHLQAEPDGFTAFHNGCAQCPPNPAVGAARVSTINAGGGRF